MFIGNTYIVSAVSNLPGQTGGATPPVETFNILAQNGDTLIAENGDNLVTEVAP